MPRLSVIVPVYNTEKYLRECIDSILAQTFSDFELILVDDGSPDGSGAICDEYADKDPRIQVIHQENGGVTNARKAAMRIAQGEWISFVDSDDWIHPDMFKTMLEKATGTTQIVICDVILKSSDQSETAENLADEGFYDKAAMAQKIYPTMIMDLKHRRPAIFSYLCNKIFQKSLLETVFWSVDDSFIYAEDALCSYAAILGSEGLFICHSPLYYYRQHEDSAVHQYNGTKRYANLLRSYAAHEAMLQARGLTFAEQMQGFIAVSAMSNMRKVLLFDKKTPLHKRFSQAKEFVAQPGVASALQETVERIKDPKVRFKMKLAFEKRIKLLYLLFGVKEVILRLKA